MQELNEIKEQLKNLQAIINNLETKEQSAREWLREVWEKAKYNPKKSRDNRWTFFIGNDWYFQQDTKNKKLYYQYARIFVILKTKYKLNDAEVNELILDVVGEDINCKELTPQNVWRT